MPSNLNALIRYKTINNCLYGGRRKWSIDELIEACSEALAEYRGRYERVSERTIRDDLRVMKSDMLGYNAPIKVSRGLYYYSDPAYSIMKITITDTHLAKQVISMLFDLQKEMNHPQIEIIIKSIMDMCGENIFMPWEKPEKELNDAVIVSDSCAEYPVNEDIRFSMNMPQIVTWQDILALV